MINHDNLQNWCRTFSSKSKIPMFFFYLPQSDCIATVYHSTDIHNHTAQSSFYSTSVFNLWSFSDDNGADPFFQCWYVVWNEHPCVYRKMMQVFFFQSLSDVVLMRGFVILFLRCVVRITGTALLGVIRSSVFDVLTCIYWVPGQDGVWLIRCRASWASGLLFQWSDWNLLVQNTLIAPCFFG